MSADEVQEPFREEISDRPQWPRRFVGAAIALVLVVLAIRWFLLISPCEIGWETVVQSWQAAIHRQHTPVASLEPIDQATFWLVEADRILTANPNNAELAMGAAIVLDSPGLGFMANYLQSPQTADGRFFGEPRVDYNAIQRAVDRFEEKCRSRCLQLAAYATEKQPSKVNWWRLRAILLFRRQSHKSGPAPRDAEWSNLLAECTKHDQDNALYDYLVARYYISSAVQYIDGRDKIVDRKNYNRGMEYLRRGLNKPFCETGENCSLPIELLRRSHLAAAEYSDVLRNQIVPEVIASMRDIQHAQVIGADERAKNGDLRGALALRRDAVRLADHLRRHSNVAEFDIGASILQNAGNDMLTTFVTKHPELVSAEEWRQIQTAAKTSKLDQDVLIEANKRFSSRREPTNWPEIAIAGALVSAAQTTVLLLLLPTIGVLVLAKWLRRGKSSGTTLGLLANGACWLAAYALTFVVFGMAPAEIIPPAVQGWLICGSAGLLATLVIGWVAWRIMVRRRIQYTIRTMLLVMFFWALLLGLLRMWGAIPIDLTTLNIRPHIAARTWCQIDPSVLRKNLAPTFGVWAWAATQWHCYGGPYLAAGAALLLVAICQRFKAKRDDLESRLIGRYQWAAMLACLGRSSLSAAVAWLLVYLALSPFVVRFTESQYQTKMAYLCNPQAYCADLKKTMAEVRADWSWMKTPDKQDAGK